MITVIHRRIYTLFAVKLRYFFTVNAVNNKLHFQLWKYGTRKNIYSLFTAQTTIRRYSIYGLNRKYNGKTLVTCCPMFYQTNYENFVTVQS